MKRIFTVILSSLCGVVMSAGAQNNFVVGDEVAFFGLMDLRRPDLTQVREAVAKKDWGAAKEAWSRHLDKTMAERWIWSYRERNRIVKFLNDHDPSFKGDVVKGADQALRREFRAQEINRTLNKDMIWEAKDWGYEWGNVLNRHQYWKYMGEAWGLTGDSKYAKDWAYMVRDWIKDNPVKQVQKGPWRSLETGIRVSVWLDSLALFMQAPECDASLRYEMTQSLVEHARLLYDINNRFRKGNWQTCECSGLASVGIVFPEFKEAAAWRQRAFDMMRRHMQEGVFPDGAQCELTPGYHSWVLKEFLELIIIAEKNGYDLSGLTDRHEKMFEFLMDISKPDLNYPPLGDAGSGRSIRETMARGALVYNRPDMRYLGLDSPAPDWAWTFPIEKIEAYGKLPSREPTLLSYMLPYAKYGVMRTGWKKDDRWLLFDCAPYGGAHSHQDQLQILLYSGRDLLMDSGQIPYDNPLSRSYFKTDQAHNVLLVNGKGPQRGSENNPEVLCWSTEKRVDFTSGKVNLEGATHQRSVIFVKPDYWVIVDHVTGKGEVDITRLFHLPVVPVKQNGDTVRTCFTDGDNLWIAAADDARIDMRKGRLSGEENGKEAPVAAIVNKRTLPTNLCTVLVPFGKEDEIPSVEQLDSGEPDQVAVRLTFKDGRTDWITIASKATDLSIGGQKGKGIALCVRNANGTSTVDVIQQTPLKLK